MSSADANFDASTSGRATSGFDAASPRAAAGGAVGRPLITLAAGVQPPQVSTAPPPFPSPTPVADSSFDVVCGQVVAIPSGAVLGVLQLLRSGKIEVLITGNEAVLARTADAGLATQFSSLPFNAAAGEFQWASDGGLIVLEIPVQLVGTFFLRMNTGHGGTVHVCCDCGLGAYWAFDKGSGANDTLTVFAIPDDVSGLALNYSAPPPAGGADTVTFGLMAPGNLGVSSLYLSTNGSSSWTAPSTTNNPGTLCFGVICHGVGPVNWSVHGSAADLLIYTNDITGETNVGYHRVGDYTTPLQDASGTLTDTLTGVSSIGVMAFPDITWPDPSAPYDPTVTITVTPTITPPPLATPTYVDCLVPAKIDLGFEFQFPTGTVDVATSAATSNSSPLLGFDPTKSNGVTMFGWFKVTGTPASIPSILLWSDDQGQSVNLEYKTDGGGGV